MPTACQVDTPFNLQPNLAKSLANEFGTPLYVLSEQSIRARSGAYRHAFAAAYPHTALSYASKANGILAVLRIVHEEGCFIDVASEGELRAALLAGVPASDCEFHGNNKSEAELRLALEKGIRAVIIDNFEEIERIRRLWSGKGTSATRFLLRLAPGVDPKTHHKISTGQEDSKFGFNIADGSAARAVEFALCAGLPLVGLHCHVGSQLLDPEAQVGGGEALAHFAKEMRRRHGFEPEVLNLGGGLGIRYTQRDRPLQVDEYCRRLVGFIEPILREAGMQPTLMQEPGRSLVGEAGVTLYTVGSVKTVPTVCGPKTYVAVDGGMSDNPRPALYGASYTVQRTVQIAAAPNEHNPAMRTTTVSGRHCETDELFPGVPLPADIAEGDILQVLCTGAYNACMASNYNRFLRPATVLLGRDGLPKLIQRRETWEDLFGREVNL